jgi:ABC-2 type transport system permease protein
LPAGVTPASLTLPIDIRSQVWYNPDLVSAYFMIPGVIGMILYALTSILTATAIVRERERGTIEQLIVTPIRPWELILGKLLPYVILAFFNTLEVLALGAWWFKVPIRGDLSLILAAFWLVPALQPGDRPAGLHLRQYAAGGYADGLDDAMLPGIFLSGFFFPLEAMPTVLQLDFYLMPLRYYLVIIRSLMLKNVGVEVLSGEIIALVIFGLVLMIAASFRFRKRLD